MKFYRTLLVLISLLLLAQLGLFAEEDEFNVERLPLGNPATKWNFGAVKLNQIYDTAQNRHIDFSMLLERLQSKRIVMIGESHTSAEHHDVQYQIIKGLVERGQPVCLALEMFTEAQNPLLNDFIAGKFPPEEFVDRVDWFESWGYHYRLYQQIFEYAQAHQIKLYGVNLPRNIVNKVGRMGLKALSAEERANLPAIDTTNIEHQFLVKAYLTGSDAVQPTLFRTKYEAQCLWDAVMAEGTLKAARENPEAMVILLAGDGHVAYNLGIGKVIQKRSEFPLASVLVVEVPQEREETLIEIMHQYRKREPNEKSKMPPAMQHIMSMPADTTPSKIVVRSLADFLWGKPDSEGKPTYPSLGLRLSDKTEAGFEVTIVFPKSIAQKNGIQRGDLLLEVDGNSFTTKNELTKYLHTKNWDDPIALKLLREDQEITLEFVLKWEKEK